MKAGEPPVAIVATKQAMSKHSSTPDVSHWLVKATEDASSCCCNYFARPARVRRRSIPRNTNPMMTPNTVTTAMFTSTDP